MSRICAVCLSDLHLGSEHSVFTAVDPNTLEPDIHKKSSVLVSLVDCLKAVLSDHSGAKKPSLVLAGDVLELALATTNVAATVFAQFLELLIEDGELAVDSTIVYVPGNHDHHLWETARERQYASYVGEPTHRDASRKRPLALDSSFPVERRVRCQKPERRELPANHTGSAHCLLDRPPCSGDVSQLLVF